MGGFYAWQLARLIGRPIVVHRTPIEYARSDDRVKNGRKRKRRKR